MATLVGRSPKDTLAELLTYNNAAGIGSTLNAIGDGVGNVSPLQLSTTQVSINNLVWPTTGANQNRVLAIGASNQLEWRDGYVTTTGTTFTGNVKFYTTTETVVAIPGTTGTRTIPVMTGTYFTATISGATTFAFSGTPTSGDAYSITIEITNGGSANLNWPASVVWPAATAPVLSTSGVDYVVLITRNGGTTWYGRSSLGT